MPGGEYDSSITRVEPVFNVLSERTDDWVRRLLNLAEYGNAAPPSDVDLTYERGYWGECERGLKPPVALLSWLIRNLEPSPCGAKAGAERTALIERHQPTIESGLRMLRGRKPDRHRWYILEGSTYPDVVVETPAALIVIEGKRTEAGPTTYTTWKADRHQIWRHMDAAWEIRGKRAVYGLFLVEGVSPDPGKVPDNWKKAAETALSPPALAGSFPHRSEVERHAITRGFLGVATWQRLCACFAIDSRQLPSTVVDQLSRRKPDDQHSRRCKETVTAPSAP
jgi:hypothetical protein